MPYKLDDQIKDEILELNDIVDVINDFISLKKAGANYNALCPFHKEKTPSFIVSPDKQMYHCFGCGEGGDAINFIMKYKNYTFIETIEYLASRAGIILEEENSTSNKKKNNDIEKLFQINREAAIYYYNNLKSQNTALKYLNSRKIDKSVIKKFGLGYAKGEWEKLLVYLKSKGFLEKDIYRTGLIIKNEKRNSYYDRFRNRIIFPIFNVKNKIIGFGGRVLDNSLPKYINSPDSELFNKGRNLYGLNISKENVRNKYFFIVEGYMDVIKMHTHGYNTAVASLGTALTENQIKLMKKYSKKFYIAYDSDDAGLKAALKAINMFKRSGIDAKVIVIPGKSDPDEYLSNYGKVKFNNLIKESLDYYGFLKYFYTINYGKENKLEYIKRFFENLANINSSIERELILEKLAKDTGLSKEAMLNEYNRKFNKKSKPKNIYKSISVSKKTNFIFETSIIEMITANNSLLNESESNLLNNECIDNKYLTILKQLFKEKNDNKKITFDKVETLGIDVKLENVKKYEEMDDITLQNHFKECMKKIETRYYINLRKEIQDKIKSAEDEKVKDLIKEIIDLDKKIKRIKEEVC